ncbi:MaoC/PaaZ C-terminal domain-containing protein [Aeromicrobium sp. IC_218]|uniref:MaoC/PaaZ C-terminal domain-containing protein n=1 Tax=Aeromicrobium sp. IC_218 TaxID=2545468 RepID=UPI00103B342A|nr:MaoC/PaaZ C-terminal domain-containing protein [Aeromicrobium sp. IC_218]TCI96383.1 dehydratase [Aeromicrobium sp. IC_218]
MTLWFDDLVVGRSWTSPSRTVTGADVGAFAGLTGDHYGLHTSEEFARRTPYGTRIAHGLLGLTFAHGLMWARTGELNESVVAFLGMADWRFRAPLHLGATIHVEYEVTAQRRSESDPSRGVVEFGVRVLDHDATVLQDGTKTLLVAARPR